MLFQRLNPLEPGAVGAEELTPEELPVPRFDAEAQESAARTAQFQPAARARRFFCFFLRAARLRAVFLRFFTRMAVSYLRRRKSLSANPPARTPSVSTIPGLMAFTRMLRGAQLFGQRSGHGMA